MLAQVAALALSAAAWEDWLVSREWATEDTVAEAAVQVSLALDYLQTRQLRRQSASGGLVRYERNPILGSRPSEAEITRYFAAAMVGHAAVAYLLPRWARLPWQGITLAVQVSVVSSNYSAGLTFKW